MMDMLKIIRSKATWIFCFKFKYSHHCTRFQNFRNTSAYNEAMFSFLFSLIFYQAKISGP